MKDLPGFVRRSHIAPQDPIAAADELERAVTKLGLNGVMINGNIRGEFLDDKKFWPIFGTAQKLDVPIYIHPKMPPADMLEPYLSYPGLASAMAGFAAEAMTDRKWAVDDGGALICPG